jgi:hypothetical protein
MNVPLPSLHSSITYDVVNSRMRFIKKRAVYQYFLRPQIKQFLQSMPSLTDFVEKNNNIYDKNEYIMKIYSMVYLTI